GTGTGTIARGVAEYGCDVYACDPAVEILEKAKDLSLQQGVSIKFSVGSAEITNYPDNSFDLVLVGQAWHWFDYEKAIQEILRILKPDGKLVIAHFDWLPHKSSVADLSETLVTKHNPRWKGANGTGFYPEWTMQLAEAGFTGIESWSFDKTLHYKKESWLGRIRASAGISGSLSPEEILVFDREHSLLLDEKIEGNELLILHRCFTIVATPPKMAD
ncbi:MAG: class I SAM-dependent methyltransferase, partial [Proteobacteria bacterium]